MKVGHCEAGRTLSINRDGKSAYAAGQKYVINGTQVNHAQLLLPQGEGILISYDDQDGNLPYGKEYACELVLPNSERGNLANEGSYPTGEHLKDRSGGSKH